jgi:signal transduction histidine kinase/CheY-like chemotaxis protein
MLAGSLVFAEDEDIHAHHVHDSAGSFFDNLFKVYTPRRVCMNYEAPVIWLHFVSDLIISLAYYSIPIALIYFVHRRKDIAFHWIFWMFALFILGCGTTHVFGLIDLWTPAYKVDGIVKAATAGISIVTAIVLWPLIPKALTLPSPARLEHTIQLRTAELGDMNLALRAENEARRRAEKEREQLLHSERIAREEAERANQLKDDFLATLSHELRTPLNAILGWSQILQSSPREEGDLKEGLAVIERSTRAQTRLIEDLLDVSRIKSGQMRLDLQSVNLADVIERAIETILPVATTKGVKIRSILDPRAAPVTGDAARLQQVVWNLLSNAVKFTPQGGKVEVLLERVNSHLEIIVSDTGVGITADFLDQLFERFRQADSSTTRTHGGLGLGLAIVKHLVEMHGGTVRAKSPGEDQGATFIVNLPVRAAKIEESRTERIHPAMSDVSPDVPLIRLDGLKVLAIDDDCDSLQLIRRLLESAGASVVQAASAREGLESLRRERPDVILCDIGMPGEDGYGFLRKVRQLSAAEGGATPAVAVTAFARSEDRTQAMRAGFQNHLAKPFEPVELLATVGNLTGRI